MYSHDIMHIVPVLSYCHRLEKISTGGEKGNHTKAGGGRQTLHRGVEGKDEHAGHQESCVHRLCTQVYAGEREEIAWQK